MTNNISMLFENMECCGCGACINVCPQNALAYTSDYYGFIIPKLKHDKCVQCGKCLMVCPAKNKSAQGTIEAYAAMARDTDDRMSASSGGIFGVLAKNFIENKGMVVGVKMDTDFKVHHEIVKDIESLNDILKSKYVQSDMGHVYIDVLNLLKKGNRVLFSGTPCQISAIKNYIPLMYRENLFLVDVVCHGVPSQAFFDSYINYLETKKGEIEAYRFRAKRQVDNGMNWFLSYTVKGESEVIRNWPEDTFNYLYMKSYIHRNSCYNCQYSDVDRCSDITLCDFWGWENYQRGFKCGNTISGILINTDKGKLLLDEVKEFLYIEAAKIENIQRHNGCLTHPPEYNENRELIFKAWKEKGFAYIDEYYQKHNRKMIIKSKLIRLIPANIMNFLVKIRRMI